jgi:hypothetical protein
MLFRKEKSRTKIVFNELRFNNTFFRVRLISSIKFTPFFEFTALLGILFYLFSDFFILFEDLIIFYFKKLYKIGVFRIFNSPNYSWFSYRLLHWIDSHHIQQFQSTILNFNCFKGQAKILWDFLIHNGIHF